VDGYSLAGQTFSDGSIARKHGADEMPSIYEPHGQVGHHSLCAPPGRRLGKVEHPQGTLLLLAGIAAQRIH
jgi:hypothetical protein